MDIVTQLSLPLIRLNEFYILLRFYVWRRTVRSKPQTPSTWCNDRTSMRHCWDLLDKTGKSYAPAIKELGGELAQVLCVFYLVLRGLDTIEDDMILQNDIKQSILRSFHIHTVTPGWNFMGSGPDIKDRQLLIEYHHVVEELNLLPPKYKSIIIETTHQMAAGMADYAQMTNDGGGSICLATIADYNLYGHYVGGLMGAGLLRTFFALEGEGPCTPLQLELSDCWGRCSADFIRDYREDVEEERYLWPKEIWSKEQYGFGSMQEMYEAVEADEAGEKAKKALYVQSEMVLEALRHASDSLDFLRLLKKPNVLHFASKLLCANFAKLEVCFMNKEVFRGDVKVRKAEAAKIMMSCTNLHDAALLLCEYGRKIQAKADKSDPNFLRISIACEQIEQWFEYHFPSDGHVGRLAFDLTHIRTPIPHIETERDLELARSKRRDATGNGVAYVRSKLSRGVLSSRISMKSGLRVIVGFFLVVLLVFSLLRSVVLRYGFSLEPV